MMRGVAALVLVVLALLSLRGSRGAYALFVALSLAYFPAAVGFAPSPRACQLALDGRAAMSSLTNYAHVVLFGLFFLMSYAVIDRAPRPRGTALLLAGVATLLMGAAVEIAQGATGAGNCRLRDLIPDSAGIAAGAAAVYLWLRVRARVPLHAGR